MNRAVFLDRDDTLIANREVTAHTDHPGDLFSPAQVRLLPGVARACRLLKEAGYLLVVVSNQGAVARGRCTWFDVKACNDRMQELIRQESGVGLDGVYFSPFHPKGTVPPYNVEHPTRKPGPGMLVQAAQDLSIDVGGSWMIGDAPRDLQAAIAAGVADDRALLVGRLMNARFSDMPEAASWIVSHTP